MEEFFIFLQISKDEVKKQSHFMVFYCKIHLSIYRINYIIF